MQNKKKIVVLASNYGGKPDKNIIAIAYHLASHEEVQLVISTNHQGKQYWPRTITEQHSVVSRTSLSALMYMLMAHAILYTHSLSDAFPYAHRIPGFSLVCQAIKVFLQHGVIGLKKNLANGKTLSQYLLRLQPTFDYMVVSSSHEANLVAGLGINSDKIKVTGLPRFDLYKSIPRVSSDNRKVLIFLTWQAQKTGLGKLSYLIECLESHDEKIEYDVINHPMISKGSPAEISISDYSLLITDDSSLAWDFFYTYRDVIFFRPGEWLTHNEKLDSLIAHDSFGLNKLLAKHFINSEPTFKPSDVADWVDANNCERVAKLIHISR